MTTVSSGTTVTPFQKPTLQLVYTTEFGDRSEVILDLYDSTIDSVFHAVRQALVGCGFAQALVDEWFPEE